MRVERARARSVKRELRYQAMSQLGLVWIKGNKNIEWLRAEKWRNDSFKVLGCSDTRSWSQSLSPALSL